MSTYFGQHLGGQARLGVGLVDSGGDAPPWPPPAPRGRRRSRRCPPPGRAGTRSKMSLACRLERLRLRRVLMLCLIPAPLQRPQKAGDGDGADGIALPGHQLPSPCRRLRRQRGSSAWFRSRNIPASATAGLMCPAVPPQVNRIFIGKHLVLICLIFSPAHPCFGAGYLPGYR